MEKDLTTQGTRLSVTGLTAEVDTRRMYAIGRGVRRAGVSTHRDGAAEGVLE
jgi:hypothetical protein